MSTITPAYRSLSGALRTMGEAARAAVERAAERIHAAEEARARAEGWQVERSGAWGLSRTYRHPIFTAAEEAATCPSPITSSPAPRPSASTPRRS